MYIYVHLYIYTYVYMYICHATQASFSSTPAYLLDKAP